jgi:hypothetical protein
MGLNTLCSRTTMRFRWIWPNLAAVAKPPVRVCPTALEARSATASVIGEILITGVKPSTSVIANAALKRRSSRIILVQLRLRGNLKFHAALIIFLYRGG